MPCYHPMTAYQSTNGGPVSFAPIHPVKLQLPCGQCVGCRLDRSRMWALRCVNEAQWYEEHNKPSIYVTLTYNNENLPENGNLCYPDFQKFMKRLKKSEQRELIYDQDKRLLNPQEQIRFYMAGEYGEQTQRPHYHAIIYGWRPSDAFLWRRSQHGNNIYRSDTLATLWGLGNVEFGEVTFQSAAYVARYCMKKVTGQLADSHYTRVNVETGEVYALTPEFNRMSLKPGIGYRFYDKYKSDFYPHDHFVHNGKKVKIPRYYDKQLEREDLLMFEEIKQQRIINAKRFKDHNTPERLAVREQVKQAQVNKLKRGLTE